MKRRITFLIFLTLLFMMMSCGTVYHANQVKKHQRKIDKHLNWLRDHGAKFSSDTLYKQLGITVPEVNLKFETRIVSGKTEVINFKRPEGEVNLNFTQDEKGNQTVTPDVKIPPQIIYRDVPYKVETTVECKQDWRWYEVFGYCAFSALIFFLIGYFFKSIKRLITLIPF